MKHLLTHHENPKPSSFFSVHSKYVLRTSEIDGELASGVIYRINSFLFIHSTARPKQSPQSYKHPVPTYFPKILSPVKRCPKTSQTIALNNLLNRLVPRPNLTTNHRELYLSLSVSPVPYTRPKRDRRARQARPTTTPEV